ncbi:MAG: hypothetical protein WDO74_37655 [Pseudomonadota bacterium]
MNIVEGDRRSSVQADVDLRIEACLGRYLARDIERPNARIGRGPFVEQFVGLEQFAPVKAPG